MDFNNNRFKSKNSNIQEINAIIGNVNQNIQNLDEKFNYQKDYSKNSQLNEIKTNFMPSAQLSNKMDIDSDFTNDNSGKASIDELAIINEVNGKHTDVKKILFGRKNSLKRLAKFCVDKDVPSTLNYLSMINELSIYHDFLNYALLQTDTIRVPLTIDNASFLLSHVIELINSKYDNYRKVGIHSSLVLLKLFSDRIITTKGSISQGIDISKEDRIKKCDKIIDIFKQIRELPNFELSLSQKQTDEVRFLIYDYRTLLLQRN